MEKYYTIPALDGFEIKGILNSKEKSDKLVVFVHGLTGNLGEAHYYCAKDFFIERGYDVFRFNLYNDGVKNRKLETVSIKNHGEDIQAILEYFENSYSEINIVGHSLAGPSIVMVDRFPETMNKIVFWDPAFDTSMSAEKCFFSDGKIFRTFFGMNIEISSFMYHEFLDNKHIDNLSQITFPYSNISIIYADRGGHLDSKPYTEKLGIDYFIIEGANHGFTQEGKYKELFDKTLEYIKTDRGE